MGIPTDRADVRAAILGARRVPCICPQQHDTAGPRGGVRDGAKARCLSFTESRGVTIERVGCERCPRTWTRVNAR